MSSSPIRGGEVAWYVTGRFYVSADGSSAFDAGYFLHLPFEDLDDRFTFLAQPFSAKTRLNGDIKIGIDPIGEFSVFYDEQKRADYNDPASFGSGLCIATFRRNTIVAGVTVAGVDATNAFSATLIASTPFDYRGRRHDFADFVPHGVTQFGTASIHSITPLVAGTSAVLPFVGSAIAVCGCS
jgi:hypothetical protein